MLRRRIKNNNDGKLDRWLVSYADFITLLFAFFVVLYAISSVNIGKFRIVSSTLDQAFKTDAKSIKPVQVGELARSPVDFTGYEIDKEGPSDYPLQSVSDALNLGLEKNLRQRSITMRRGEDSIELEMKDSVLFKSGSNELKAKAIPLIQKIAQILDPYPNALLIEGFTDNLPIDNIYYPSNWDLSVARAAMVTRMLELFGVDPRRMAAVGYGEYQPLKSNNTLEGRRQNRRVVIVIKKVSTVRDIAPKPTKQIEKKQQPVPKTLQNKPTFVGPSLPPNWQRPTTESGRSNTSVQDRVVAPEAQ